MVGANGAGKSTVSRLCNGLLKPQEGHVFVKGQDTRSVPTSTLAKDVGFLFQNPDRPICQPPGLSWQGLFITYTFCSRSRLTMPCKPMAATWPSILSF